MKTLTRSGIALVVLFVVLLFTAQAVGASGVVAQDSGPLDGLIGQLVTMGGVAALIAILVNILKSVGIVQDGTAKTWAVGFNVVALGLLYVLQLISPQTDLANVNDVAGSIAQLLTILLQLVVQFGFTLGANGVVKGLPVVGYSNTAEQLKSVERGVGGALTR